MFGFFGSWLSRRIINRHRLLFRFWDGNRYVSADPFVIFRALVNTEKFDPENDVKDLKIPDAKILSRKISHIAEGVREIFNVPAFEKGGLSELECIGLLNQFNVFMDDVKKNGASNQITLPPTATPPADQPSVPDAGSAVGNDMNENLAFFSIVSESTS